MSLTLLLFSLMLFQQSICTAPTGCNYKTSPTATTTSTDGNYLKSSDDANVNKLKCFSLSNTDVNTGVCCYYIDTSDNNHQYCTTPQTGLSGTLTCPVATEITNNCGMALYYQPEEPGDCTDISLVDSYCCYVQTKNHGKACIRQGEIDEDDKNKITDEMKNAVNRLKGSSISGNVEIEKVQCEGYYMTFYGLSLLLLAVML